MKLLWIAFAAWLLAGCVVAPVPYPGEVVYAPSASVGVYAAPYPYYRQRYYYGHYHQHP